MNVIIVVGGQSYNATMPQVPAVGDTVEISVPGAPFAPATVKHRAWKVGQFGQVEATLQCV
jgi:hypothetical protein